MDFIESGKTEEAIDSLGLALELSPQHSSAGDLLYNRGSMYKRVGNVDAGASCGW